VVAAERGRQGGGHGGLRHPRLRADLAARPLQGHIELALQPMYTAQMAEFLDSLASGRQPRPSGEDGRVVMQVVQEAYRSAATD
jgi:predicted dehydrogenase